MPFDLTAQLTRSGAVEPSFDDEAPIDVVPGLLIALAVWAVYKWWTKR